MAQSISQEFTPVTLLKFALPSMVMMVLMSCYTITDGFLSRAFLEIMRCPQSISSIRSSISYSPSASCSQPEEAPSSQRNGRRERRRSKR